MDCRRSPPRRPSDAVGADEAETNLIVGVVVPDGDETAVAECGDGRALLVDAILGRHRDNAADLFAVGVESRGKDILVRRVSMREYDDETAAVDGRNVDRWLRVDGGRCWDAHANRRAVGLEALEVDTLDVKFVVPPPERHDEIAGAQQFDGGN